MTSFVTQCRLCGGTHLRELLDLGLQAHTGIFPQTKEEVVERSPLVLVQCEDARCGLVQLTNSVDSDLLYGSRYGYLSGINGSMVQHLRNIAEQAMQYVHLQKNDLVLDIGSNDGTLLNFFDGSHVQLAGIDPIAERFRDRYPAGAEVIADYFSAASMEAACGKTKAKVITSIAMLYDLKDPRSFVKDIASVLHDDGIWILEQSYLPLMLQANSYDTVCHEHLEYYGMKQMVFLLESAGLGILHVSVNDANGGSIRIVASKNSKLDGPDVLQLLEQEHALGLQNSEIYERFAAKVFTHKNTLRLTLTDLHNQGKTVLGLGASTKGNVLLQHCGLTSRDLPCIAEINPDKFGTFTPGTGIPIVSQSEADALQPDYYLVLPWHFRAGIIKAMSSFLARGGKLIFPLPEVSIVGSDD